MRIVTSERGLDRDDAILSCAGTSPLRSVVKRRATCDSLRGMENESARNLDAFLPAEMARRAEDIGVKKAAMSASTTLVLAVLAGAFIALGAIFATTVTTGAASMPYGAAKLLGGLSFCLGLILVIVAGAELFTGNNLIVMALASKRITLGQLLRNWGIVYVGNFVGAVATAALVFVSGHYTFAQGAIGHNALNIANAKCQLGFAEAVALGTLCNALVCLAVWLCFSARTSTDKILSIIFPITAFVAAGFEHSVANMYFVPIALFIKSWAASPFWNQIGLTASDYSSVTWTNFVFGNLLPVTIGNIIGGAVMVGMIYWLVYHRKK